jgi:hypothetical protein
MRLVLAVFAVVLSIALVASCSNKSEEDNAPEEEALSLEGQEIFRLIAKATEKTYQNRIKSSENIVTPRTSVVAGVSYEIDQVRIKNVVHYETASVPIPFIEEVCGKVKEVYITLFGFRFVGDDSESSAESSEVMIIFKGDKNYYGCLLNGGGSGKEEFSSHKRLTKNSIDKDFSGTVYQFLVESNGKGNFLTWASSPLLENIPKEVYDLVVELNSRNEISADDLYFVEELKD